MKSSSPRFILTLLILAPLLTTSCNDLKYLTDNSPALLEYLNHPTQYNLADLSKSYSSAIKISQKRDTISPGLFSEYAVSLALLGKNSEANKMFNNEVAFFPNSARYVRQLKLLLVPEYVSDTISDTSTVIDINLDDYRETDDSNLATDPALIKEAKENAKLEARRQRELIKAQREAEKNAAAQERELIKSIREKEKIQRELEKEAAKDSIELAKKEQQKIKEQIAEEKERLKKEKQLQKEEAKRQKAEQKAEAKRQKEIQREEARRQKEEARRQKELQKEEQRRQREEESDD